MRHKRILFVLGQMKRGGAERVISILSRDYAKKGWQTDICTLLTHEVEYQLDVTTEYHSFAREEFSRIRNLLYWIKSIRKHVSETQPDVIVSFVARINVIVILACLGLNKKIIISERNDPRYDGRGFLTKTLTRILYPLSQKVVFQTKQAMLYFSEKIRNHGVVIPNPIEITESARDTNINKIVAVGSLKTQKNHRLLIEAFEGIVSKYPEKKLCIYGDGTLRQELENLICTKKLVNNVFLMGAKSDIHEHISDAAVFVLSSDYEGLSNALLEAMMMGLPCVSTDCAGADEFIENKINGLIVPVGDKEKLQNAILAYIENETLRRKCGESARKIYKIVGLQTTLEQWHAVID